MNQAKGLKSKAAFAFVTSAANEKQKFCRSFAR